MIFQTLRDDNKIKIAVRIALEMTVIVDDFAERTVIDRKYVLFSRFYRVFF